MTDFNFDENNLKQLTENFMEQMHKTQDNMKKIEVTGKCSSGQVSISVNGLNEMTDVHINPALLSYTEKNNLLAYIKEAHKNAGELLKKKVIDSLLLNKNKALDDDD